MTRDKYKADSSPRPWLIAFTPLISATIPTDISLVPRVLVYRNMSFRFGLKHLLIGMAFVACFAWYAVTGSDWPAGFSWILGTAIGAWQRRNKYLHFVYGAAFGGAIVLMLISPFAWILELQDKGTSLSNVPITSLLKLFVVGGFVLAVIGFACGAVAAQISWPIILLFRRYMNFVDKVSRPMNRE